MLIRVPWSEFKMWIMRRSSHAMVVGAAWAQQRISLLGSWATICVGTTVQTSAKCQRNFGLVIVSSRMRVLLSWSQQMLPAP